MRHESTLKRTARRYSLCDDDAEDALQRALEILLTKAPSEDPRELIRWTQTVVKHEALAVRRERERILSGPAAAAPEPGREDWVALLPSDADGPAERAERHETVARSREALRTLKPQELRALTLLAEGYSYAEIGEITGYSHTKINRCLAEGRERFRQVLARTEDGSRCEEMRPLLSAFCDGEATPEDAALVREHLRACLACRATLRAYRAAPGAAAALVPSLPLSRSLLERLNEAAADLAARFGGRGGGDAALSQVAGGGAGLAGIAKTAALCACTAGGIAAGVATGTVPFPLDAGAERASTPALEREIDPVPHESENRGETRPRPSTRAEAPAPRKPQREAGVSRTEAPASVPDPVAAPEAEFVPEPEPEPIPEPSGESSAAPVSSGSPAGEFGP